MSLTITTNAFPADGDIPQKYTCDGADLSPALSWNGLPSGTKSLALIADDPDAPAGTWTHWIIWNIPVKQSGLPENVLKTEKLGDGTLQGRNDFRKIGYGGPCPPAGKSHRYFFRLYALDDKVNVPAGASRADLERAMKGHILGQAEVMGKYGR